ncbi:tyrosine-type recombinase/integrase [Sessilibacter corallicola]|uniref:Tyrosine-type recombinase/integrase n=1 Tax=Sessilibacter corallicola TaxID=2904075 RepID=A0ABQ0ADM2_9GAMM
MARLTKSYIDGIPLPEPSETGKATQTFYRDDVLSGFGLRVGSGGTKSFFVERRVNGRVKRISIGKFGHITPQQARIKAQEMLGEIAMGDDPSIKRKAIYEKSITLQQAFDDYVKTRNNLKTGTLQNYTKCLEGCLSDWLNKRLIDISKEMVEQRHRKIGRSAPARANNTMRVLRAVFNHAISKYEDSQGNPLFHVNPVLRLSQGRSWYTVERRQTVIAAHELKKFYEATEQLSVDVSRDFIQFLLFTGLRKMEAATITWQQVDFNAKTMTFPETKNGKTHVLPLTDFLEELLRHRKEQSKGSEWVFPSPVDNSHLREPRSAVRFISEYMGRPFTLHDLRRTFITIAESLDIPAYALKQLINHHNPNDVTAGYIVAGVERIRVPMNEVSAFILSKTEGFSK